jgi:LPXTG-site transpeptidase (sortase) family protein
MSLKVNDTKRKIVITLGIILLLAFIGCILRVIIWEHYYYRDQVGKPRETPTAVNGITGTPEEIDETPISPDEVRDYVVAADMPRYLSIPEINVEKTRILAVGLTNDNKVGAPKNSNDTAWYNGSSKPGTGGTALIDGHNSLTSGVFKDLAKLKNDSIIYVEMGSGITYKYSIVETNTMSVDEANRYMSVMLTSPVPGKESLSLITCYGEWSQNRLTREGRTMIRAVLVDTIAN